MKLTEEQKAEIHGFSSHCHIYKIKPGSKENVTGMFAIDMVEKFGGIQWISVKDRLPEGPTALYYVWRDGHPDIDTWYFREGRKYWDDNQRITHWAEINLPNQ